MNEPISRRAALSTLGTMGLGALLAACTDGGDTNAGRTTTRVTGTTTQPGTGSATADLFDAGASCTLSPEQTEGPFYFDVDALRRDLREDRVGTPLRLALRVRDAAACTPIADAVVDVWHCDAVGSYSGFEAADGETYLRGAQVTSSDGIVEFVTIYPGWYPGRTVHVHTKIYVDNASVLTTQLYFDEDITESVSAREPYARPTERDAFNGTDTIFDERLLLTLSEDGDGYLGVMTFDVETP